MRVKPWAVLLGKVQKTMVAEERKRGQMGRPKVEQNLDPLTQMLPSVCYMSPSPRPLLKSPLLSSQSTQISFSCTFSVANRQEYFILFLEQIFVCFFCCLSCMELHLGLALPTNPFFQLKQGPFYTNVNTSNGSCSSGGGGGGGGAGGSNKRRGFDEETRVVPKTLRLLLWNSDQPDGEDDRNDLGNGNSSSSAILKNDGEGLVGWPPVKAWRKKPRRHAHNGRANNNRMAAAAAASNSTYVKVKMEGNAIARKIDLSVHGSFESLTSTLMRMFDISEEHWQRSFKLAYQDRQGDWLLAEDVPWRTFIRSLKCIKLIRR
ncbi:hypothetical protein V6N13_107585 [Hibiscus sabdariffa]